MNNHIMHLITTFEFVNVNKTMGYYQIKYN